MKQQTELMRQILKNPVAQKIIDYVSPIYGDSYVALWIYEVIGIALSEITKVTDRLRYEANPITTELLMDYWEDHYGLHRDSTLTMDQRRARLLDKIRNRAPANPERLSRAMENILGVPVDITERVAKNTFRVEIQDAVSDFRKLLHAIQVLNQRKPAHLIYEVNVASQVDATDLKLATATTMAEDYHVGVEAIKLSLQATLEKAIKLGAVVTVAEQYGVNPKAVSINTVTDLEHRLNLVSPIATRETYSVEAIKRQARIAVEAAFNIAAPVFQQEEFTIEEVKQ